MSAILINAIAVVEGINNQLFITSYPNIKSDTGLTMNKFLLLLTIQQAIESLSTPVWGALGDVYSKRMMFMLSAILFIASTVATGFARSFAEFVAARVLSGLSVACFLPISHALLTETVDAENRPRAHGYFVAYVALGSILGATFPLINLRWQLNFIILACLTGALAVALGSLYTFEPQAESIPLKDSARELFSNLKSTLQLIVKRPTVTAIFVLAISAETCNVLLPLTLIFLQDHLPAKIAAYTFSVSCVFSAIGGIVSGTLAEKDNRIRLVQTGLGATLIAAYVLFFTGVPGPVMGVCLCMLTLFIPWPQITISRPMLPEYVKANKTATALAWLTAVETGFAALLGPPVVSTIHSYGYSLGHALGIIVIALTSMALVASISIESVKSRDKIIDERESLVSAYGAIN